jgi:NADPH oxidase
LREVRSRHVTYISKVIQHPSNVVELQIKKEKTTARAGQYIFINCPEISLLQWHAFTLTRYAPYIVAILKD